MNNVLLMTVTLLISLGVGRLFMKFKIPGGLLVGVMLVFSASQILTGSLVVPPLTKDIAQIIAGSFTGASLSTDDLKRLPRLWKGYASVIIGLSILNIIISILITQVSDISLITALFGSIPGGMGTMSIISEDFGADPIVVTIFQFTRMIMGIGLFPSIVVWINKKLRNYRANHTTGATVKVAYADATVDTISAERKKQQKMLKSATAGDSDLKAVDYPSNPSKQLPSWLSLLLAAGFGILLNSVVSGLSLMVCVLIGMALLNLFIGVKPLPIAYRRIAQVLSGIYVGTQFYSEQLAAFIDLIIPILIMVPMFLLGCLVIGYVTHLVQKLPLTDAMLGSIPAGASDIVLILDDLNIQNTDIVVLQILRLITVTSLFPQINAVVAILLGAF